MKPCLSAKLCEPVRLKAPHTTCLVHNLLQDRKICPGRAIGTDLKTSDVNKKALAGSRLLTDLGFSMAF